MRALSKSAEILGILLITIVFLELFSGLFVHFSKKRFANDRFINADAIQDTAWIRQYLHDEKQARMTWEPYTYFRMAPEAGQYVNIDDNGLRKTWNPHKRGENKIRVFMFGGSTMWGLGARDDYTIPSIVSKELARQSTLNVEITNFGQFGYVSTQELIALMLELQRKNKPDIAVFYDAWNDTASGYRQQIAGLPQNEINRVREFNILATERWKDLCLEFLLSYLRSSSTSRIIRHVLRIPASYPRQNHWSRLQQADPLMGNLPMDVANSYISNVTLLRQIAHENDFPVLFYLQPISYTKKHPTKFEQEGMALVEPAAKDFTLLAYNNIERAKRLASIPEFHDISHILDDYKEPIYFDFVHLSEHGNEIVGKRIAADLMEILEGDAFRKVKK